MRLTRVEIHGFKSFADRTQLDLPAGLTAVVGPNGCGKSNVIDAIKWALGEQRASALRGDEMLDVIFKGNGARTARNFAEVALHFDNADKTLPIEFAEVVVARRLFRTGESEYLINRQPARLKDVRDLFMDTGLGTGAYSIMEQGRIDAILSADPQDRRRIFEEAAGISRYRARRRESESKLERTDQNLLRLGDIVEELEKQVRSLKQQAGRARSFLVARDRLAQLKSRFYVHRWEALGVALAELSAEGAALERDEQLARQALSLSRGELEALRAGLETARGEVDVAAEGFRQATGAVEALAARRTSLADRERDDERRGELLADRERALTAAAAARAAEAQQLAARLAELAGQLELAEQDVVARQGDVARVEADFAAWRAAREQARAAALERAAALAEAGNRRADAAARHAAAGASHERLSERSGELQRQLQEQDAIQGELFAGARDLEAALRAGHGAVEQQRALVDERRALAARLDEGQTVLREQLAGVSSRRQALAELIARHDGLSPGAVALLESDIPGVGGLLVDTFKAPRALAEAVEAALGSAAGGVLVATRRAAGAALEALAASGAGRAAIVCPEGLSARRPAPAAQSLLAQLTIKRERAVLEALLGHVVLLPSREALAGQTAEEGVVYVTREGDLLDGRGVLHGGRAGGEAGLVARRAECEALEQEAEGLRAQLAAAAARRAQLEAELAAAEQRLAEAEAGLRRHESERARATERETAVQERRQALTRELALLERDRQALAEELQREAAARDAAAAREAQLEALVAADRGAEERAEAERLGRDEALAAVRAALGEARLTAGGLVERRASVEAERRQVERAAQERRADLAVTEAERATLAEARQGLAAELAALVEREGRLAEARDAAAGTLNEARARAAALGERVHAGERSAEERQAVLDRAAQAVHAQQLRLQEAELGRRTLREKVLEELSVDLESARPEASTDEGDALPVTAEGGLDWPAIEVEIEELRGRLARMGNVNLAAVDELTEVEERHAFLTGQRDDLLAAKAALLDTIARVNSESRERFVATFEEIREYFRQIFRKLFRGGKADVQLAEGADVLEAGIDIVAAPPGKDPRSITLLSGGERTLTAVGLLFALFRAKPSPVCMLDEVDAALDETNIDRFCTVLEDFLGGSQFLVVTHARRTMSYADTLYGITMQEHGVSRALSLTLSEWEEARDRPTAAPSATVEPTVGRGPRASVVAAVRDTEAELEAGGAG